MSTKYKQTLMSLLESVEYNYYYNLQLKKYSLLLALL